MRLTAEDRQLLERCIAATRSMASILNVPVRDVLRLEVLQAHLMSEPGSDLRDVAAKIKTMLLTRAGEVITPEVAEERANNLAQAWPCLGGR